MASESDKPKKCHILEIVQYSCETEENQRGQVVPHCFPIPRLFKLCPGRPAVEITTMSKISETGEIEIPSDNTELPRGKPWHEVHVYPE
ncbi:hypothetical protein V8B97DRAFT_1962188 [Scleroderma yunnanense]